ncbi:MAG: TonB-dependent receptor [Rikenellaceae bacterium]
MKNFKVLIFAVLIAVATVPSAVAATLKGKVIDKSTNEPLIGATVMVKGTTQGVTTDLDGNFEIDLDRKPHTLSVSYVSYTTQELDVDAKAKLPDMMIHLESDSQMIAAVKVVTRVNRESEFAAIADQRNAIVATQVVGVRELSRKGVGDAEGAVMKVSGVSKQEGVKNVFVRGLGDRYNSTTLNGLPIPSEEPEYKNISLDFFSTDVIQSVNVNKAFYAPGVSDVGGANIDIASKKLSGDGALNVSISGGVNTQTIGADMLKLDGVSSLGFANNTMPTAAGSSYDFNNLLTPSAASSQFDMGVGVSGGKRFEVANNPLTFYVVASYDRGASYSEELVRSTTTSNSIYKEQQASISELTTSYLALANVSYAVSDKHMIDYNFMYVHSSSQSVGVYEGSDSEVYQAYDLGRGILVRQQVNDNSMYINQLVSKWALAPRLRLDVAGSYNSVIGLEPDRRVNYFGEENDGSYTQVRGDSRHQRFYTELKDGDLNAQASVTYSLKDEVDSKSTLKLGYSGRFVTNNFNATEYNQLVVTQSAVSSSNLDMDGYFNSSNMSAFQVEERYDNYEVTKNIHSAYADLTYEFSPRFIANVGVKYDMVDIDIDAVVDDIERDGGIEKNFFLPSLNLRYSLNDKHSLRFSASQTYTLPQAKELSPYRYIGANFNSEGNENLLPSDNYNVDVKWDWYISNGELFSVTGFYKHIANPISRIEKGTSGGFLSYENIADHAVAAGVEVEFRKNIFSQDLGEGRSNRLTFGLNGSYIYTQAKVDFATDPSGSQLEGAAPYIANTDLSYSITRGTKSFTNTVVLNYVSDKIYTIGTEGYNDIVEKGVPTLDFVSSAKLNDKLSLTLKARNLLDSTYELSRESSNSDETIVLSSFKKGMDISLGLSYSF